MNAFLTVSCNYVTILRDLSAIIFKHRIFTWNVLETRIYLFLAQQLIDSLAKSPSISVLYDI